MKYDLECVPGIGPKAKEILQKKHIQNSFQLVALFLNFKDTEGDDCITHCTKFYSFLTEAGIKGNRHSITKSIAEKVAISFPNLYVETQFAHLEPMESEC
jgi:hypothetical protein